MSQGRVALQRDGVRLAARPTLRDHTGTTAKAPETGLCFAGILSLAPGRYGNSTEFQYRFTRSVAAARGRISGASSREERPWPSAIRPMRTKRLAAARIKELRMTAALLNLE